MFMMVKIGSSLTKVGATLSDGALPLLNIQLTIIFIFLSIKIDLYL